jgi:PIN domain nuclease of toxin-antitoxin system
VRLLLDTHTFLWALLDPALIPKATRDRIADARSELLVSAASAWEIGTKFRLGKLDGAQSVVHGYAAHLRRLRAEEVLITSQHALTAGMLTWDHRDPFDRLIAAQSMIESVPVVTADEKLAAFAGIRTMW